MRALILSLCLFAQPLAAEPLRLVLDWFTNPDHAPILVAQTRGYYKAAGIELEVVPPADPSDPPKLVASGQADLAVSYQPQLYLLQEAGLPVVRVGALIDQPLYCVLTPLALKDLAGKRIGYSVPGVEEALLGAMLRHNGVDPASVTKVDVHFALATALASGEVEAASGAFRNFEPHQLEGLGQKAACHRPEENGVPAYDELIFLADPAHADRDLIARFLAATGRAAAEIKADPAAGWRDFIATDAALDDEANRAAWPDTVPALASDPAGYDPARYAAFGAFLQAAGLIEHAPDPAALTLE